MNTVEQNIEHSPFSRSANEMSGRNDARSVFAAPLPLETRYGLPVDAWRRPETLVEVPVDVPALRQLLGLATSSNRNSWYLPRMETSAHPFRRSSPSGTLTGHPDRMTLSGIAGMNVR